MSWLLVLFIILELAAIAAAVVNVIARKPGRAAVFAVIALLVWLPFSFKQVDANTQSVRISLGKPTGDVLGAGPHLVAPWSQGSTFSAANQWIRFRGRDNKAEDEVSCINARLARQSSACVDGIVYYTQPPGQISTLFSTWKTEDRIRSLLVLPQTQQALNAILGTYDPLASATQDADVLTRFSAQVTADLITRLPQMTGVKVELSTMDYDDPTEDNLKQVTAAIAKTRVAAQDLETAKQIAEANRTIADSLKGDAVTAFYQCVKLFTDALRDVRPPTMDVQAPCANTVGVLK